MHIDLHTHTTASDGVLKPRELVALAERRGVRVLSITDHDTVAAYAELEDLQTELRLVPGIEFSTQWRRMEVHIVGLDIRLDEPALIRGIALQQQSREQRAERIAARLEKLGLPDPLPAVQAIAGTRAAGRPHFARHLVDTGRVADMGQAFKKFLAVGKPGYCRPEWAALDEVIAWIQDAGGTAVLAHPAHYNLTRTKLAGLLTAFAEAGGNAMEVVSGVQSPEVTASLARLCVKQGLLASCGSDFHQVRAGGAQPGGFDALPPSCTPVWQDWHLNDSE
jgi:predicted metal-dependent phosphoesterase TrpH